MNTETSQPTLTLTNTAESKSAEQPILSVTDISLSLKNCVEQIFGHVRVRGEVSGLKKAASGHTYFSLKDQDSVLSAVCWRGRSPSTMAALQEGLEVICTGKLSTYPGRSNYQMIVSDAEPAGIGALLKLLQDRKEKLEKEGLFDPAHKKNIPYLPETIGVITSPTGAVIRDIMHRLDDRFPRHVYLWPVLVQGEGAAQQITNAINGFNAIPQEGLKRDHFFIPRPDVLIVARGGGSLEDLWCFNEENVVRAAYASRIPLISAVGHETDTTLIDYVSDLRAPTPTGAAEKAVPVRSELLTQIQNDQMRLTESIYRLSNDKKVLLDSLGRSLPNLSEVIETFVQKLDDRSERLENAFSVYFNLIKVRWETASKLLKSYSYRSVLDRGFTLISSSSGKIINQSHLAEAEKRLTISFSDGNVSVIPCSQVNKSDSSENDSDQNLNESEIEQEETSSILSRIKNAIEHNHVQSSHSKDTPCPKPESLTEHSIQNGVSKKRHKKKSTSSEQGNLFDALL